MSEEKTIEERLAAAKERKAKREEEHSKEEKARELAILELEERLEAELGGRAGEVFTIIDAGPDGPIAAKVGAAVLYKQFHASIDKHKEKHGGDGITPETCQVFVTPLIVFPEKAKFLEIIERHQGLLFRLANACESLYTAKRAAEDAKR